MLRSKLLPLLVVFVVLAGLAFIGYQIYLTVQKISSTTSDKMQHKNMVFTKDGMKVGVKELKTENYVDKTQGLLVKAWNLSETPAYKSKLWSKPAASTSGAKVDSKNL